MNNEFYTEMEENIMDNGKEQILFEASPVKGLQYRILSLEEKQCFTREAYDFFMKLIYNNMIDYEIQEEILDRCLELYPELVSLDVLKGIIFYTSMGKPELQQLLLMDSSCNHRLQ